MVRDISDRRAAEDALVDREQRYRTLFESSADAVFLIQDGRFHECNARALRMFGGRADQIIGQAPGDLSPPVQPDGRPSGEAAAERIASARLGRATRFTWVHRRLDGVLFDAEVALTALDLGGERVVQALVRDVTERNRDQARLARLTVLYQTLSAVNEAIVRVRTEDDLFEAVCRALVQEGGAAVAWMGLADDAGAVRPVAWAGPESSWLETMADVSNAPGTPGGEGTTGRAVRDGAVTVCNDVGTDERLAAWRESMLAHGLLAVCSFPLVRGGGSSAPDR